MAGVKTLTKLLGDHPKIRVISFLVENSIFDYSKKDICKNASVSWNTMKKFWRELEQAKIVKFTRKVGKAKLYKLNTENPVVKQLIQLDKELLKRGS